MARHQPKGPRASGGISSRAPRALLAPFVIGLTLSACGASAETPPPGESGIPASDAGASAFVLRVVRPAPGATPWRPLAGVRVALDAPGGARQEGITDVTGQVTFAEVDWSAGDHTVSAHKEGYVLTSHMAVGPSSRLDAAPSEDTPVLRLQPLVAGEQAIRVTGSTMGLLDAHHSYLVNVLRADVATEWIGAAGQPFSVWTSPDMPFVLQGLELDFELLPSGQGQQATIYRVAHQPVEPACGDLADVQLDLEAWAMTTYTADFTWTLPSRPESPLRRGTALGVVAPPDSRYTIGWGQYIHIDAAGDEFDVSMLWVEPFWASDAVTQLRIHTPEGTALAVVDVPGYPQDGMKIPVPLDVPELHRIAVAHPIGEPIQFTWHDPVVPSSGVDVVHNDALVWRITMRPGATSLAFPTPPTGVDLAAQLSANPRFFVWGADVSRDRPHRWVRSLDLGLAL